MKVGKSIKNTKEQSIKKNNDIEEKILKTNIKLLENIWDDEF